MNTDTLLNLVQSGAPVTAGTPEEQEDRRRREADLCDAVGVPRLAERLRSAPPPFGDPLAEDERRLLAHVAEQDALIELLVDRCRDARRESLRYGPAFSETRALLSAAVATVEAWRALGKRRAANARARRDGSGDAFADLAARDGSGDGPGAERLCGDASIASGGYRCSAGATGAATPTGFDARAESLRERMIQAAGDIALETLEGGDRVR